MKTVKVFLASSDELQIDRLEFADLIQHLNRCLKPRDIEIELVKWEYLDSSMGPKHKQEEYNEELKKCEMCLVLYWTKFGDFTKIELDTAYHELCAGNNPQKLYVFFKDTDVITPELKEFRDSFVTEYGHFFCRFENVDTMRLHFMLQFEEYQNKYVTKPGLLEIKESQVAIDGVPFVNLTNVAFAGNNPEYQQLLKDVATVQRFVDKYPDDSEFRERIKDLKDRQLQMETSLLSTAQLITKLSSSISSARLQRATELFQSGDNKGANALLNTEEIKTDAVNNIKRIQHAYQYASQAQEALLINIEELRLKIRTISNAMEDNWVQEVVNIYEEVISYSKYLPKEKRIEYLSAYAHFLQDQRLFQSNIESTYRELIYILKELYDKEQKWIFLLGSEMNSYGVALWEMQKHDDACTITQEAFEILARYRYFEPEIQINLMVNVNNNLATYLEKSHRIEAAEKRYKKSLEVLDYYLPLIKQGLPKVLNRKVQTQMGLAGVYDTMQRTQDAEALRKEYIQICSELMDKGELEEGIFLNVIEKQSCIELLRDIVKDNPRHYAQKLSEVLLASAYSHRLSKQLDTAEKEAKESLEIMLSYYSDSVDTVYTKQVSEIYECLAHIYFDIKKYDLAEFNSQKAIEHQRKLANNFIGEVRLAYALQQRGDMLEARGEYSFAEECYLESLSLIRQNITQKENFFEKKNLLRLLSYLGRLHTKLGKYEDAGKELNESMELADELFKKENGYLKEVVDVIEKRIRLHEETQDVESLEDDYKKVLSVFEKAEGKDDSNLHWQTVSALYELSSLLMKQQKYSECIKYASEGIDICRTHLEPFDGAFGDKLIDLLMIQYQISVRDSKYSDAEENLKEVIDIAKIIVKENPNGYSEYLAARLKDLGDLEFIVIDYAENVKEIIFNEGDIDKIDMDSFATSIKKLDEAEQYYDESLNVFNSVGKSEYVKLCKADIYCNLGRIHNFQGNKEVCSDYLNAINIYEELTKKSGDNRKYLVKLSIVQNNLGMYYVSGTNSLGETQPQNAIRYISDAISTSERISDMTEEDLSNFAQFYVNLGMALSDINDNDEAYRSFQKALDLRVQLSLFSQSKYLLSVAWLIIRMGALACKSNDIYEIELNRRKASFVFQRSELESSQYEAALQELGDAVKIIQSEPPYSLVKINEEKLGEEYREFVSKFSIC